MKLIEIKLNSEKQDNQIFMEIYQYLQNNFNDIDDLRLTSKERTIRLKEKLKGGDVKK